MQAENYLESWNLLLQPFPYSLDESDKPLHNGALHQKRKNMNTVYRYSNKGVKKKHLRCRP